MRSHAQGITENNAGTPGFIPLDPSNATDIWISSSSGTGVNNQRLRVGGAGDYNYTLLRFDLAKVPADATSVTLLLFCVGNNGGSNVAMSLDVVTSPWDTSTAWQTAPSFAFLKPVPRPTVGSVSLIDITLLWQQWKSGAIPNYGIQLRPVSNANEYNEFHSTEALVGRPALSVTLPPKYILKFPLPFAYTSDQLLSSYGEHWQDAYCGTRRLLDTGVALPAPLGTEVWAAEAGIVRLAVKDPKRGGFVVIEHDTPAGIFTTIYSHLEPLKKNDLRKDDPTAPKTEKIKEGDVVQKGDVIGRLALGSEVAVPQLHFQIREAPYSYPVSIKGRLPEIEECGGDPAFPEKFHNPRYRVKWQ